jgi:phosphotransferase system IIA component
LAKFFSPAWAIGIGQSVSTWDADDKDGGWGYVIRDESGDVIQSGAGRVPLAINPMHAKLIACMEGVKAAAALGIDNVILETDTQGDTGKRFQACCGGRFSP